MRKNFARKAVGAFVALALTAGLTAATTGTAQAASNTCSYPYVCLYVHGNKTGQYRDVTSSYQSVTRSATAQVIHNTRNDDVVHLRWSDGVETCVTPNTHQRIARPATLTGLRISWSASC
ncbi:MULTISPECIES: hypothetical protein [Streptomyces]|uniref:hypothetical protein n=1 Tax=Streptomyces TaxID=1883 RepID=UPI0022490A5E|nr:hypothetical protein [Streptomyces sp. JHD 1]MCX2969093.1 hypothetical protein [Streptomyces sp. JHD 1]